MVSIRLPGVASVFRNSGWLLGSQIVAVATRVLYVVILARWLSPDAYGLLNYGVAWYLGFLPLTYLGLDVVLGRRIGRTREGAGSLVCLTLVLRFGAALVTGVVAVAAALFIETDPLTRNLLQLFSAALLGRSIWLWYGSVATAFENTRPLLMTDLAMRPFELVALVVYLAIVGPNLVGIAAMHATLWMSQGIIGFLLAVRMAGPLELHGGIRQVRSLLAEGLPCASFALAIAFFLQAPIILFRHTAGLTETLGFFALALQMIGYLQVVPYIVSTVALPVLARSAARQDGKDGQAALVILALVPLVGAVLAIAIGVVAEPMVSSLFGRDYAPAATMLGHAAWLLIPISLAISLQQFIYAKGSRSFGSWASPLAGMLAGGLLIFTLAQPLGYIGVLLGMGLGTSIWAAGAFGVLVSSGFFRRGQQEVG